MNADKKHFGLNTYKIRVTEPVTYDLIVQAHTASLARRKVRAINDGHATFSDFSPNQEACPVFHGNVVINSVEELK
jgi:hypothetical protein